MNFLEILEYEVLTNTISDYLIAFVIVVLGSLAIKVLEQMVLRRLKLWAVRTNNRLDDALFKIGDRSLIPILYLGIFYIAIANLSLHPILLNLLKAIALIATTFLGIRLIVSIAEYLMRVYLVTRGETETIDRALHALLPAIRTAAWLIGIIFLLDNLGFNISAVVASLGIGGIAIALASQGVLQDLFSYFSILFDRPFEIGDFIVVNDMAGTVDYVGIKTTRIKSISGEEVVVPNTNITASRIHNYKRMERRRILFKIGVIYETPQQQLQEIPAIIREIVEPIENTLFDRAHFLSFGDFSLDFEVVYHVLTSDYGIYMDIQQQINYQLKSVFEEKGIEFAYPTQVTYFDALNGNKSSLTTEPINRILNS